MIDPTEQADVIQAVRDATSGRGPDAVIDPVGTEAHCSPLPRPTWVSATGDEEEGTVKVLLVP